jgi:hypothetical protein
MSIHKDLNDGTVMELNGYMAEWLYGGMADGREVAQA